MIAPAMNTTMWFQAATQRNIERLKADGVFFVEPVSGRLACETVGTGKLEDVETIVAQAMQLLSKNQKPEIQNQASPSPSTFAELPTSDLKGERFLITTGGTREEIDPVRFISNHSSGKMGFALAAAAKARGAKVTIVAAATSTDAPENIDIIRAVSANEMHRAVTSEIGKATVFISAAAVADYRPATRAETKIKKTADNLTLILERTPDILAEVSKNRHDSLIVVGFAAETNDVLAAARSKMERKNLDLIVANDVSDDRIGFGSDNNAAVILRKDMEEPTELSFMSKREMADKILDEVVKFRKKNG
jgi:phosphopantothenoylcysteine decarboxylase/phosphopantothenate--cysteine ligase